MENSKLEEIFNKTFSGLALFYRDTNLADHLISKYYVGQILNERGFTDMSYKGGGFSTNFRYLIASSQGRDLSALNPDSAELGHIILQSNAYFKVLDITQQNGITQVLLLEIPEEGVEIFSKTTTNIEEDIIEKAKENFENHLKAEPVKSLQTEDWKQRVSFPLGMSSKGELFYKTRTNSKAKELVNSDEDHSKPWWKFW